VKSYLGVTLLAEQATGLQGWHDLGEQMVEPGIPKQSSWKAASMVFAFH
jgi:hypothetical protein